MITPGRAHLTIPCPARKSAACLIRAAKTLIHRSILSSQPNMTANEWFIKLLQRNQMWNDGVLIDDYSFNRSLVSPSTSA